MLLCCGVIPAEEITNYSNHYARSGVIAAASQVYRPINIHSSYLTRKIGETKLASGKVILYTSKDLKD
jgi:hypothetical protein